MHRLFSAVFILLSAAAHSAAGQITTSADTTLRVAGQAPRPASDSLYRRARRLVAEGNGTAGRGIVDSLLRAADPATPAYGDALYWHGALAPTAAEAERDYRRVIVEYPLAYYADDALLAIAELEQARGDRAGALMHLQRFVKEHPSSPGRGIAALGAARLAFEQRDTKLGCSMLATARTSIAATDVEMRNQIEYYDRQCTAAAMTASAPPISAPPISAPPVSALPASAPVANERPPIARPVVTSPAQTTAPMTRAAQAPASHPGTPTRTEPGRSPESTMPTPVTPAPRPAPAPSSVARPAPPRRESAAAPPVATSPRATKAPSGSMYTIQLAAYGTRPPAEALVRKLATRGVKARVSGSAKPFRVRLDFYRTRQEATNVVTALKARGIVGFVAEEVPPAGTRSP